MTQMLPDGPSTPVESFPFCTCHLSETYMGTCLHCVQCKILQNTSLVQAGLLARPKTACSTRHHVTPMGILYLRKCVTGRKKILNSLIGFFFSLLGVILKKETRAVVPSFYPCTRQMLQTLFNTIEGGQGFNGGGAATITKGDGRKRRGPGECSPPPHPPGVHAH